MKTEEVIRLIVIDDSSNDAEVVTNIMRNAGHAVRTERVEDDEDLRETLAQQDWDMVLCKPELPFLTAQDALHVISQMELDLPLVVLAKSLDDAHLGEILRAGARDVVSTEMPQWLVHTLLREIRDHEKRRRHRECEQQLHEANRRSQTLVDSSRDAIAYVHEGMHIYANEPYLEMFGYSDMAEIEGMPLMNMVSKQDQGTFKEYLRSYSRGKAKDDNLEVHGLHVDGRELKINMEFTHASYEGEPCTQIIIRDTSLSKELEQKLDHISKQDLVTGVYNRQYFLGDLQRNVGREGKQGTLLYIRPDEFKAIREKVGITSSDAILADMAALLDEQLPSEEDILARFDSHVFSAILHGASEAAAAKVAEKMLKAVDDHIFDAGGQSITLTVSIGMTPYSENTTDPQELLARMEKALSQANTAGGNRQVTYNPAEEEMAEKEQLALWTGKLKAALRDNRFSLIYQPIVSLHGDANENYEVLLRMHDEDGHEIMPGTFLPAAEKSGLIVAIDRWVLVNSVKALTERRRAGKKAHLFVKLSESSMKDDKLLPWLRDLAKATRLGESWLTIEVSEAVASSNLKSIKQLIEGLKQLRISFALDHFGLAANADNLLRHCDARYLKIAGSLIQHIATNPEHQDRVKELTAKAKEGGKLTIAEFVEDANTLASIWSCGVDYIQGYFVQEPGNAMDYDFASE